MDSDSLYFDVISRRRKGLTASAARSALAAMSLPYAAAVASRNAYYGRWAFPSWLDVPVISVGNITTGGTGKTPMTIWLCERFLERGRKPAVLSRGYKSHEGLADELLLISRRLPQAVAIANPNRFAAGQLAVQEYGAQAAVLDDGFQHRRMGRDLDIVLIDATQPFGFDHLLPRGLLREPLRNLRRAEAFVITRSDQAEPGAIETIRRRLEAINPAVPIVQAIHQPTGLRNMQSEPVTLPAQARIGVFAGIARPQAFVQTLTSLGPPPAGAQWFPDHHAYTPAELQALTDWAQRERFDALIATEKDAVKLHAAPIDWPIPLLILQIDLVLTHGGDKIITDLIDTMLKDHEEPR